MSVDCGERPAVVFWGAASEAFEAAEALEPTVPRVLVHIDAKLGLASLQHQRIVFKETGSQEDGILNLDQSTKGGIVVLNEILPSDLLDVGVHP